MKIFRKDKEKEKEGNVATTSNKEPSSSRARSSTNSPNLSLFSPSPSSSSPLSVSSSPSSPSPFGGPRYKDNSDTSSISSSTGSIGSSGGGSFGRASQQQQQQQQQGLIDAKKQHAIRIGDTRFYGRIICRAKALYDYPLDGDTLQVEDEEIKLLKFRKGDTINVYEQDTSGWWAGEFNDEKGIFPGSYMKVLEEEPPTETPKHKLKSQNVSREELMHKISDLEADRLELIHAHESDRIEFNRIIKEIKDKASSEVLELKRMLSERDEVIQVSNKKTQEIEMELEELAAKLAAKQVELLAVELQIREYKSKVPDLAQVKMQDTRKPQDENRYSSGGPAGAGASSTTQLKAIQTEIHSKNVELQEINRQKVEADKGVREARAKLAALEAQILRKVMTSPTINSETTTNEQREDDISMLKRQLGEEVFEKRRMENEMRDMRRLCMDAENLKAGNARLEVELASKADIENKLTKIDTILLSVINKDPTTLTVASVKELLTKVRKGIASNPNGLRSGSAINSSGLIAGASTQQTSGTTTSPTTSPTNRAGADPKTIRAKSAFFKDPSSS